MRSIFRYWNLVSLALLKPWGDFCLPTSSKQTAARPSFRSAMLSIPKLVLASTQHQSDSNNPTKDDHVMPNAAVKTWNTSSCTKIVNTHKVDQVMGEDQFSKGQRAMRRYVNDFYKCLQNVCNYPRLHGNAKIWTGNVNSLAKLLSSNSHRAAGNCDNSLRHLQNSMRWISIWEWTLNKKQESSVHVKTPISGEEMAKYSLKHLKDFMGLERQLSS